MLGVVFRAVMAACAAAVLTGCMTSSIVPTADDAKAYAIKSVDVTGVAPESVSDAIDSDLAGAVRMAAAKPQSVPVQLNVLVSSYSGGAVASGYRAGADVSVTLKPVSGGKVLQAATFHEEAASADQARATSQLAAAIAARVRRNVDLPPAQPSAVSPAVKPPAAPRKAAEAAKPADGPLSSDTLETLMKAAETDEPDAAEKTATVPVPDNGCTGQSLSACPQSSLISGDFSLRK